MFRKIVNSHSYYLKEGTKKLKLSRWMFLILSMFCYTCKLHNRNFRNSEKIRAKRLFNILLGHMSILEQFVQSGINYALILEDDVKYDRASESLEGLLSFTDLYLPQLSRDFFINVSESFTLAELGAESVKGELKHHYETSDKLVQRFYKMHRPILNTTGAVIYSSHFAHFLLNELKKKSAKRSYRTIPMDWLTQDIISDSFVRSNIEVTCIHNEPGVFTQASLHN